MKQANFHLVGLDGSATQTVGDVLEGGKTVFLLGNESTGLSEGALKACDQQIHIPMRNNVESLNVAVTAGIIAFRGIH